MITSTPARIQERDLPGMVAALHKLENQFPSPNVRVGGGPEGTSSTAMRTSLRVFLETFAASWAAALRVLSIAIVGPAAVALAALNLAAILAARRRRVGLSLARGRGASMPQIAAAVAAEGILVAAPAAILGALAAVARPGRSAEWRAGDRARHDRVGGRPPPVRDPARGPYRGAGRRSEAVRVGRPSPRRLVFWASSSSAVVGAVLLRQRGIASAASPARCRRPIRLRPRCRLSPDWQPVSSRSGCCRS